MKGKTKRILVITLAVIIAAAMTVALSGCGTKEAESKTKAKFEKIDSSSGIHFKGGLDVNGTETVIDMYIKGDNVYLDSEVGGGKTIVIVKDDKATVLNEQTKTGTVMEMADELETGIEQVKKIPEGIEKIANASGNSYEKGTEKIDGKEYDTETAKYKKETATFAYDENGELAYIIYNDGTTETKIRTYALESGVKDDIFKVPGGYKMLEQ